ncbi:MAG: MBL fold metallo-hydrolase [Bryobacteraceae bacterium]|jgi:beta-lactamase superfamily II metal-dependent hydrolase
MRAVKIGLILLAGAMTLAAAGKLEIYSIDVEGGQATLFVGPGGDSMLVDTGWPDNNHRDSVRIAAAAKAAGVKKIDYLVVTHYHADHVGGVFQISQVLPIIHFVDHGPQSETGKNPEILFHEYLDAARKGERITVKPGDTIPVKGLEVKVLAANGDAIHSALAGAGQATAECQGFARPAADATENGRSIGMLISYGDFRMLDMGDLTKDHEYDLVCPNNLIGPVDLFLVSHHGTNPSNSLPFVHAIAPRVAIMNNGPHKGGNPEVWQTVRDSRGLIDFWQIHYAIDSDKQHNSPDSFIANVDAECEGKWIRVNAQKDGAFTVYNSRNRFEKTYPKR